MMNAYVAICNYFHAYVFVNSLGFAFFSLNSQKEFVGVFRDPYETACSLLKGS